MRRGLFDRWTDTAPFRLLLVLAGIAIIPVLLLGLLVVPVAVAVAANEPSAWAVALLVGGGITGLVGWARARPTARDPERHNVTATLVCLWIGIATALALGGGALIGVALAAGDGLSLQLLPAVCFAAAPLVWAVGGIGWAERLRSRHAEDRRAPLDVVPALLLLVAVGLAVTAGVVTATL